MEESNATTTNGITPAERQGSKGQGKEDEVSSDDEAFKDGVIRNVNCLETRYQNVTGADDEVKDYIIQNSS